MTLTRAPCELDKMSLFQDLKLKRRKVDSRCSSDGESVADTSTSSPDLVSPSSPKMSEAVLTNPPPSPDSTPIHPTPEPTLDKISSRLEDSGVFDGGGGNGAVGANHGGLNDDGRGDGDNNNSNNTNNNNNNGGGGGSTTASVIRSLPVVRSQSPPSRPAPSASPLQPPRPHSSPGRPPNTSPVIIHNPNIVQQQQHQQQQHLSAIVTCQQEATSSSPTSKSRGVIITNQQQHPQQHHSPPQLWLKHSRINGVKPEMIGGTFSGHYTEMKSPSGSPSMTTSRQNATNQPSAPPIRQTPTVIMGEAGGVRTMVWSHPSSPIVDAVVGQHHPATSAWSGTTSSISNTEESAAAQMLLNLGQDRLRTPVSRALLSPQLPPSAATTAAVAAAAAAATHFTNTPLNMERLWAGDLRQLPINQQTQALNLTSVNPPPPPPPSGALHPQQQQQQQMAYHQTTADIKLANESSTSESQDTGEEEEQPMICMICEDKATGLHYGIITCEGCKGFFKRTVQNRRVYTCVADGNCEITKAQRNRCQYCRFKKCIEQGMVLQAVREDRMPGGRNSGAVYNLYKVKYKKHKKPACKQPPKSSSVVMIDKSLHQQQLQQQVQQQQQQHQQQQHHQFKSEQQQHQQQQQQSQQQPPPPSSIPSNLVNGTILKTALTNPSEVVRLRQRLDSAVSSSRDRNFSIEYSLSMIKTLIDCDEFQDIATLQNLDDLLDHNTDLSEKLCHIGDSIVYKLVQWTKRLPFYLELPVEVHTRLLTHKWHELLVLTTSAYQAIHKTGDIPMVIKADFSHEVETNLHTLQSCLASMMGREITIDQLRTDVGLMIEKITHVTLMFRQIKLTMEEYVCLKVITMLNQAKPASSSGNSSELETIHERYMTCLRVYTQHMYPQQTTRFQELLGRLPEIQSAASLLLESKMFYVPFLLNSAIQR